MKVSRTSWHYRVYSFYRKVFDFSGEPKNLCRYFWTIVGLSVVLVVFAPIVVVMGGIFWVLAKGYDGYRTIRPKDPSANPGLVKSFVAAKKQRVCPRIEVI